MIIGEKNIARIFSHQRKGLVFMARKKMNARMFDTADVECLVDDILIATLKSRQAMIGFEDVLHLLKYFSYSVNKRTRIAYFKRREEMLKECPISQSVLHKNYNLARDIINSHRK